MNSTTELPAAPRSWFYLTTSSEVTVKPRAYEIAGSEIVVFRNEKNKIIALQRRCSHMNADLALGCVKKNHLQCSFHHWEFDQNGICQNIPNEKKESIPVLSKIKSYPIQERHGLVFCFNANTADFDLPFFHLADEKKFSASSVKTIELENEWFVGPANAFDLVHFETIHLRHLLSSPKISKPTKYAYQIELDYEIRGRSFSDRLMTVFYGPKAKLDFTVFAGNFILAVTSVDNLKNYMMIVNEPCGKGKSQAKLIVYSPKTSNPLKILKREVQAHFSKRFFQVESDSSRGVFINNKTLGPSDTVVKAYLDWLMELYSKNQ